MSRKLRYFSADRYPGGRASLLTVSIPLSTVVNTLELTLDASFFLISMSQPLSCPASFTSDP